MAKDIAQAIAQTTNNKGVAGWSLKTDDNATVDPTINWQEGQMPSTVNNSARAMMTRIREEHDIVNDQLKVIKNSWGSNFLYVEVDSYTLKEASSHYFAYDLNMVISKKLTDEQYADFQAGKLLLAVNWGNGIVIENDPSYKDLNINAVINLSLSIPTTSTTHLWQPYVGLSFFGRRYETNRITIHELPYIVNNLMEYAAEKEKTDPPSKMRTVRAIPMTRSYVDFKMVKVKDLSNEDIVVEISWYYIGPREIILTVKPSGANGRNYFNTFTYDLRVGLTLLDATAPQGVANVFKEEPPRFCLADLEHVSMPDKWDGVRYRFYTLFNSDESFDLYPIKVNPEPGAENYPIIT